MARREKSHEERQLDYVSALRKGMAMYPSRPVEIWVWKLDGHRIATGSPPPDPRATIIHHERLDD